MKTELLSPAGSLANLKAAVASGADAVYLGMNKFNAREFATNFNKDYFKEAVKICKSNNVKLFLTMNTLIKNTELNEFFKELSFAYEQGIDSVIIQDPSFIKIIKDSFPGLHVHISTQAGVMNSQHANLLSSAERIVLAREISKKNLESIRKNVGNELEIFIHGALCVCISGSCLFSSFVGGRSGNRGKCSQPCRRKYNGCYYLSTKELCLIEKIPELVKLGINSLKIEGRMRTPYYVATTTGIYRKALDDYSNNKFKVTPEMKSKLASAFSRDFTKG
jgi:putative protease